LQFGNKCGSILTWPSKETVCLRTVRTNKISRKSLTFTVQMVNNPNNQISKILYPNSGLHHGGGC
jgi:hypothetical protein